MFCLKVCVFNWALKSKMVVILWKIYHSEFHYTEILVTHGGESEAWDRPELQSVDNYPAFFFT